MRVLSEIDFTDPLNDNSGQLLTLNYNSLFIVLFNLDSASISSNNSNDTGNDFTEQQPYNSPNTSGSSSSGNSSMNTTTDILDNIHNYLIQAQINDSGLKRFLFK